MVSNIINLIKKTPTVISWIFSVLFLLIGVTLVKEDLLPAIFSLVLGFFLLPPLLDILKNKFRFAPSKNAKAVTIVLLLVLFAATSNPTKTSNSQSLVPEKITTDVPNQTSEPPSPIVQSPQVEDTKYYKVTNVVDGDTVDVLIDNKSERIRLIGIDTPETVDPRKPVQCFGVEASKKAKELLVEQEVRLEADSTQGERDKYDRLLRYIFLKDGTNFALKMISDGYGHEYTYNLPYKYQEEFKEAEKLASTSKLGLWADDACTTTNQQPSSPSAPPTLAPTTPSSNNNSTNNTGSSFACNCSKTCAAMSSCEEAQYQLNACGCSARDADKDGVACDSQCQ